MTMMKTPTTAEIEDSAMVELIAANDDGVQAKLIYAAYQGTTLPVSEALIVLG